MANRSCFQESLRSALKKISHRAWSFIRKVFLIISVIILKLGISKGWLVDRQWLQKFSCWDERMNESMRIFAWVMLEDYDSFNAHKRVSIFVSIIIVEVVVNALKYKNKSIEERKYCYLTLFSSVCKSWTGLYFKLLSNSRHSKI